MPTLHIHTDESGNLDFRPSGTSHYVFATVWTYEPVAVAEQLQTLRYELLREGVDIEKFHAAEDRHAVRDQVIEAMLACDAWSFAAVVVRKDRVFESLQIEQRFYPKFMAPGLRFVLRGRVLPGTDRILIYTDQIPVQKRTRSVEKAIQQACAAEIDREQIQFHIYHHHSSSNLWLQVCDYCSWAVYRKYEADDDSYYQQLRPRLAARELVLWE